MFTLLADEKVTWSDRDVVQPKNVDNIEQRERFKKYRNTKKTDTYDKKETTEISGTYNEERHSRELNTHRIYWKQDKKEKKNIV